MKQKKQRYRRVYTRLRDFERFLSERGVDTSLQSRNAAPEGKAGGTDDGRGGLTCCAWYAWEHNIRLMDRLTGLRSFAQLLEQARGETDWRRLRAYLGVIESYSLYLRLPQKMETLAFLYELLMHREGDIRRQAAALKWAPSLPISTRLCEGTPPGQQAPGQYHRPGSVEAVFGKIIFRIIS